MTPSSSLLRVQIGNVAEPSELERTTLDDDLSGYVRDCFEASKRHRETIGINERLLTALRTMRGEYDAQTLTDIKQFGGSEVYARLTATKIRTLSASLREVYSASARPWTITPTPVPDLVTTAGDRELVDKLMQTEIEEVVATTGQLPPPAITASRRMEISAKLAEAHLKKARDAAEVRELTIDDVMVQGGYYEALWAFLNDVALFPIACIKGPVVRYQKVLKWKDGIPTVASEAKMLWEAASPFDLYFAPWARKPQDGYIIHKQPITQSELESLRGLPSYSVERIDALLAEGPSKHAEWDTYTETERADLENREQPFATTNNIDRPWTMLEFHGQVPSHILKTWGEVPGITDVDAESAFDITCWLCGGYIIGVRRNPHPTGRKPFYVTSFETVANSVYGNSISDLLEDIQSVANATLRALVNNMAIASGPQVIRNEDRFAPNQEGGNKLWPWKVWDVIDSLFSNNASAKPLEFFQPQSNASELLAVYQAFTTLADEVSSIPRYMNGSTQGTQGALRTSSGLSMMMESANRTIKQVVGTIDREVIEPSVTDVHVYLALTKPELSIGGDIEVVARGSKELLQKETLRMRRMEFLAATANPIDSQLLGGPGRTSILKEIAKDLGLPVDQIFPGAPPPQAPAPGAPPAEGGVPAEGAPQQGGTPAAPQEAPAEPPSPTAGVARPSTV